MSFLRTSLLGFLPFLSSKFRIPNLFELSVACKYLIPRRRQISVSIISLISILVIALVVWLIVVFFSITDGLEKNWVNKLTALTAPVRITPTEAYYNSYYYQADSISDASGYSYKTIGEKLNAPQADPYDPEFDQEVPAFWSPPDRSPDGSLKDLVKTVYATIDELKGVPGVHGQDFELTASHIRLRLQRYAPVYHAQNIFGSSTHSYLAYPTYLGNFESDNANLDKILLPMTAKDINNTFTLLDTKEDGTQEESNIQLHFNTAIYKKRLESFFQTVAVTGLKSRSFGWNIPKYMLPKEVVWEAAAIVKDQKIKRIIVPISKQSLSKLKKEFEDQGLNVILGKMSKTDTENTFSAAGEPDKKIAPYLPITLEGDVLIKAEPQQDSFKWARKNSEVNFAVQVTIQGTLLQGVIPFKGIDIGSFDMINKAESNPFWVYQDKDSYVLPKDDDIGDGVLLPKSFRDAGVLLGDRGRLSYFAPTASTLQEHYLPVYVAGFYDPGIIPIGGKFVLANQAVSSLIRASHQQDDKSSLTNGINVRFHDINQASDVKAQLQKAFQEKGINRYWNIETYREYEFTKAIIQELQSQKNIFMLIAVVIIVVACSNIISMLIILVNDKKIEIGILRSMGATTNSIAVIFGLAGAIIGILGSALGIAGALLTLNNMHVLVNFLSGLQGYEVFNSSFYGEVLPHEISLEALLFVSGATVVISLLAGIVPAVKACLLRPSHIFRSSGG